MKKMAKRGRGLGHVPQMGRFPGHVTDYSNFETPRYLWNGWRYRPQILHADWP